MVRGHPTEQAVRFFEAPQSLKPRYPVKLPAEPGELATGKPQCLQGGLGNGFFPWVPAMVPIKG